MRIISGSLKGRKIPDAFKAQGVKPSSDLLKGVLFNILGKDIEGKVFCDLYAGTGNVGFEALSRGASFCIFVERSRSLVSRINRLSKEFGVSGRTKTISGDVLKVVSNGLLKDRKCDIIFLDPPYNFNLAGKTVNALANNGNNDNNDKSRLGAVVFSQTKGSPSPALAQAKSIIIVQHHKKEALDAQYSNYCLADRKIHGRTALSIYNYKAS